MPWLNHPAYVPVRDRLIARLKKNDVVFRKLNHIILICGAANSARRSRLTEYISKSFPNIIIFRAEDVWNFVSANSDKNALEMEDYLASLSDVVIILVESAGTLTELGAFSMSDSLRLKLLPILDKAHIDDDSFINTGPIRWIDKDSTFQPSIFCDMKAVLTCTGELSSRLNELPKPRKQRGTPLPEIYTSKKHLLYFICDLVAVLNPSTPSHIHYYAERIIGDIDLDEVKYLLGLGSVLGILRSFTFDHVTFFCRPMEDNRMATYHYRRDFDFSAARSGILNALLRIPVYEQALSEMNNVHVG